MLSTPACHSRATHVTENSTAMVMGWSRDLPAHGLAEGAPSEFPLARGARVLVPCGSPFARRETWAREGVCRVSDGSVALVVVTSPRALSIVGGLPLAVRAVLARRAAGTREIAVFARSEAPRLRATLERRGVRVRWLDASADAGPLGDVDSVAIVPGDVLVDEDGVRRAPVCPATALPRLLGELAGGAALAMALRRVGVSPEPTPGAGLWVPLNDAHSPDTLEAALLDHLARRTTVGDSYLARLIDRRVARPLTRLLLPWPITPSQITLVSIALGLVGAAGLATTSYAGRLGGGLALLVSIWLDCVDGEVARARFEQSAAGARLDVAGDYLVHLAVFLGLGIGLARQELGASAAWAAGVLVAGVVVAMAVMHALFIRPALVRGGDIHWAGDGDALRGTSVATVLEKLASRDYTYLLLIFAAVGHLEWFVYAAAAGSWLFVAGLVGYWSVRRRGSRRAAVTP